MVSVILGDKYSMRTSGGLEEVAVPGAMGVLIDLESNRDAVGRLGEPISVSSEVEPGGPPTDGRL